MGGRAEQAISLVLPRISNILANKETRAVEAPMPPVTRFSACCWSVHPRRRRHTCAGEALMRHLGGLCSAVVSLLLALQHCQMAGSLPKTVCPSGLRGWTQVPLAQAARVQIPQLSDCVAINSLAHLLHFAMEFVVTH